MIAVLDWALEHWFLIFLLSALGIFESIRDFFVGAWKEVTGVRHKRRNTCKYCNAPCNHACHPGAGQSLPEPWVDQARGIARELLRYGLSKTEAVPPELLHRIDSDPALFWLRGEAAPPGEWRDQATGQTEGAS